MTLKTTEPYRLIKYLGLDTLITLVTDPNTQPELLAELARSKDWRIRCNAAKNPNTPVEALIKLVKDEAEVIRNTVRQNHPEIDWDMLDQVGHLQDVM